ncbi:helix-turn-helix domain-containing protein [Oscillospiraceae bacterium HCP3S3_D12]
MKMRESKYTRYDALPLTLTVPEVGEVLGISRAAAYELVRSRGFPSMRIGTRILVPKDKFIQWIDQQTEVDG